MHLDTTSFSLYGKYEGGDESDPEIVVLGQDRLRAVVQTIGEGEVSMAGEGRRGEADYDRASDLAVIRYRFFQSA